MTLLVLVLALKDGSNVLQSWHTVSKPLQVFQSSLMKIGIRVKGAIMNLRAKVFGSISCVQMGFLCFPGAAVFAGVLVDTPVPKISVADSL